MFLTLLKPSCSMWQSLSRESESELRSLQTGLNVKWESGSLSFFISPRLSVTLHSWNRRNLAASVGCRSCSTISQPQHSEAILATPPVSYFKLRRPDSYLSAEGGRQTQISKSQMHLTLKGLLLKSGCKISSENTCTVCNEGEKNSLLVSNNILLGEAQTVTCIWTSIAVEDDVKLYY